MRAASWRIRASAMPILDFNLFFLGFKSDNLKLDGDYDRTVFDFPNAVSAAQAMLTGGDYFELFDFEGPFFMAPLRTEPLGGCRRCLGMSA